VAIAAVRSSLWIALLLADKAWLTNNNAGIAGNSIEYKLAA